MYSHCNSIPHSYSTWRTHVHSVHLTRTSISHFIISATLYVLFSAVTSKNLFLTLLRPFKQFPHRRQHNFVPTLLCHPQHNLFLTCLHPSNKDIQLPNFPHQQTQNMQSLHHHQNNLHARLFLLHNGHRFELSPPANIHHKSSPTHSSEKPNYYNEYSK